MLGDIHCNSDTQNIISKIDTNPGLAGVIILGDMTYHNIAPGCIEDMTKHWKSLPTFRCVLGNHDMAFIDFYDSYCAGSGQYWRRTITTSNGIPFTLLGINSEIPMAKGSAQYNWFNGFIKTQSDSNSIIIWLGHTPCKGYSPDVGTILPEWTVNCNDLLNANNKAKIDAFVFGHIHCLSYYNHIAISGVGGTSPKDSPFTTSSCQDDLGHFWSKLQTQGYLLVTVDTVTKKITYEFKDKNNIVIKKVSFS